MAILWDSVVSPDDLTTFVREVPLDQSYVLNRIFPDRPVDDIEVRLGAELTLTRQTAKYRAWDAPPAPLKRDGWTTRAVKLPPMGGMLNTGELERLQIQRMRSGGGLAAALERVIYNDAKIGVDAVNARVEVARGDLLVDGKVTISENDVEIEADFGVPAGNFVTANASWATASTDVLGDLRTWSNTYRALNGFAPGGFVCSEATLFYLLANTTIRSLFSTNVGGVPSILSMDQVRGTLANYRVPGLLFTYDAQASIDGVSTDILPADKVIFLPPGEVLGYTAWGLTATALEAARSAARGYETITASPGIAGVVDKDPKPPYREEVVVDAAPLPVLERPNQLFVADVIP